MNNAGKILRTGEELWLTMFASQLAYLSVKYELYHLQHVDENEWVEQLLYVQGDLGKLN